VLAAAGERVLPIRIAGLQPAAQGTGLEEVALSDQLLAGLERAVDPNGDGATDDHVGIALVGVNAPYAGFGDSAEARAVENAQALGTLVVAPAGDEGPGAGAQGTVGSPGAAPDALTVGALAAPAAVPRLRLTIGDAGLSGAALLARDPPPDDLETGPVVRAHAAPPRRALRGRLAVVEAGDTPVARAAAAAAAGARAVLLAEPRPRRPLPALPGGRLGIPVAGVTGAGARIALAARPGTQVDVGEAQPAQVPGPAAAGDAAPALSPFSSRGPAANGALKPDLAAPGAALTAVPGRGGAVVGGSAIAAAEVAVEAARLARLRPDAAPGQLRAGLLAAAQGDPAPPVRGAGAGVLRAPPAGAALTAFTRDPRRGDPCPGSRPCTRIVIVNRSATGLALDLAVLPDDGTNATVSPARLAVPAAARREAEVQVVAARGRLAAGRLEVRSAGQVALVHPFGIRTAAPAPPPLGPLRLQRGGKGEVTGVRFALGAFTLGDPLGAGTAVRLAARLDLTLVSPGTGAVVERLTPFAGARELLPAEYAYRVPAGTLAGLASGTYAFRATARSPAGGRPAVATSAPFRR
jgi:hypothetical protein